MFTTFAGGWPSLVLWMFHRSWHSSVVLGEACALDVNTTVHFFFFYSDSRVAISHPASVSLSTLSRLAPASDGAQCYAIPSRASGGALECHLCLRRLRRPGPRSRAPRAPATSPVTKKVAATPVPIFFFRS